MIQLAYRSKAPSPLSHQQISGILNAARKNNPALGITGMLLCSKDAFFQVLEGKPENVHKLYNKVYTDPRHQSIWMVHEAPISVRSFPNWSMGYHNVSPDAPYAKDFFGLTEAKTQDRIPANAPVRLLAYMEQFCQSPSVPYPRHVAPAGSSVATM